MKKIFYILSLTLLLNSCNTLQKIISKNQEVRIATVDNNVCKHLYGRVVLYVIFIDTKYTHPWTEYDIQSTLDSVKLATSWIKEQSAKSNIPLDIQIAYHQDNKKIIPIEVQLPRKTVSATIFSIGGIRSIDRWADKIGNIALTSFGTDTAKITRTKIKPKDRERLIARLRDIYKTDNVALMYFVNNYYTEETSFTLHTASDDNPEYAIVSFKHPAVIAHEFLHLFGALDLYITPFDNKKQAVKRKIFAMKEFPNEVMAFAYRNLDSLTISPFTEYLIGWKRELDEHYKQMIIGKKIKVIKY